MRKDPIVTDGETSTASCDWLTAYLAGPMRGVDRWNFDAFVAATALLRKAGIDVRSPVEHDLVLGLNPDDYPTLPDWFTLEGAMQWDLAQVAECEAIILLPGWEDSVGVARELQVARWCGRDVYLYDVSPTGLPQLTLQTQETQERVLIQNHEGAAVGEQVVGLDTERAWRTRMSGSLDKVQWTTNPGPQVPKTIPIKGGYIQSRVQELLGVQEAILPLRGPGYQSTVQALRDARAEVRVTDPKTGGQKGQKSCQVSALDPRAIQWLGEVAGYGAAKYDRMNFCKGFAWHLSYDAMQRHLLAFWSGEDIDDESGLPHMAHAMWHAHALLSFWDRSLGDDDRISSLSNLRTATTEPALPDLPQVSPWADRPLPGVRQA